MFSLTDSLRYWLWSEPTDMRKSFHTLSGIVRDQMHRNPLNGDVYVFINRHRDRIKLLHWESGGMVLYSKILEQGTFGKPDKMLDDGSLAWRDLVMIVEGMMVSGMTRKQRLEKLKNMR
jgi:transposase